MLSLQEIIAAQDAVIREVKVPEWGGSVFVRSMPSVRRDQYDTATGDRENLRARFAAWCLCDADGQFLAADGDELAAAIGGKSAVAVGRIFREAAKLNGLTEEAIEEAEKN